jgi:hypothetical protein
LFFSKIRLKESLIYYLEEKKNKVKRREEERRVSNKNISTLLGKKNQAFFFVCLLVRCFLINILNFIKYRYFVQLVGDFE